MNYNDEDAVIGSILIDKDSIAEVDKAGLNADDFGNEIYRAMFQIIDNKRQAGEQFNDLVLLAEEMAKQKPGFDWYEIIHGLLVYTVTAANAPLYCQSVKDNANRRRFVEMLAEETNLSSGEVNRGLNGLAPVLLTVLASAMLSANNQSSSAQQGGALDLSNLLNVFGGSSVQQPVQQSSGGLLGSLLGGNSAPAQNGSLLSALLGGSQPQQPVQQTSATGSLLNALLGGGTTVAQQPAQQASVGGSLLNALLGGGTTVAQQPVQQASKPKKPAKPAQQTVQPLQQTAQVSSGSGLLDALLGVSSAAAPTQQAVQQSANNINGNNLLSLLLGAMQ